MNRRQTRTGSPMPGLTRKEKQAHTKRCLMEAAAQVFTRRGMEQGSIDEVAETAGYTKGAFYANFKNKEELFLAMLDERFAARLAEIEGAIEAGGTIEDEARRVGADFTRYASSDPDWQRMFIEFAAYAARNEDFRAELVTRIKTLEASIARAFEHARDEAGLGDLEPPVPMTQIAAMGRVMANGYGLEALLFGDDVDPDLYPTMLAIFFAGVRAMSHERQPA